MAVQLTSGRVAYAEAVKTAPWHLAWGSGDAAWDTTPVPVTQSATALVAEVGRRVADTVQYVTPNPAGTIVVPVFNGSNVPQKFSVSASPTKYIHFQFQFLTTDSPTETIREVGLFINTVMVGGLPGGQTYFLPADVSDPGRMVVAERLKTKIIRTPTTRHLFEFVLQF